MSHIFKKKDLGNYRAVSLTSVPGKMMEQIIPETISRHVKNKMIWSKQNVFAKEISCLTNLIAFYDEMTSSVDDRRAIHIVYLDFRTMEQGEPPASLERIKNWEELLIYQMVVLPF